MMKKKRSILKKKPKISPISSSSANDLFNTAVQENIRVPLSKTIEVDESLIRKAVSANKSLRDINLILLKKLENSVHDDSLLQKELSFILKEKDALAKQKNELTKEETVQETDITFLNQKVSKLTELLSRNMEYIAELKTSINSLSAQNELLRKENSNIRQQNHEELLHQIEKQKHQLDEENHHLKNELQRSALLLRQREKNIHELKETAESAGLIQGKNEELRLALISRMESYRYLKAEFDSLLTKNAGLIESQNYFDETLKQKDNKILSLNNDLKILVEKQRLIDQANKSLIEKFDPISRENDDLKALIKNLQDEIEKKDTYYVQLVQLKEREIDDSLRDFAKEFLKRELGLKVEIDHLNKIISAQNEALARRKSKEEEIILELNRKFRELFINQVDIINKSRDELEKSTFVTVHQNAIQQYDDSYLGDESNVLLPLIDLAVKKGKKVSEIKTILSNAGYGKIEIDSNLKIYEQKNKNKAGIIKNRG